MEDNFAILVASTQPVKVRAAKEVFQNAHGVKVPSGVSEQPIGRDEIRRGALNRLQAIKHSALIISYESGLVENERCIQDVTCCILQTHLGRFESWATYVITNEKQLEIYNIWSKLPNKKSVTLGSMISEKNSNDWYVGTSRYDLLLELTRNVTDQYHAMLSSFESTIIKAPLKSFNDVAFLDLQDPLMHSPDLLTESVWTLASGLLFNKVVALDARGFLLTGEFARRKYPIVMARKPGKLPGQELVVEYKKEYGVDRLCIQSGTIEPGDAVIVIDDVIATGGTMKAAEALVEKAGGRVVCFIAPYAITTAANNFLFDEIARCRFLCNQEFSPALPPLRAYGPDRHFSFMFPPSLRVYDTKKIGVPIQFQKFYKSSNMWANFTSIANKTVFLFMDPSNATETFNMLQLLSVLHRKDPKKIIVVIPFLEQSTQDRVEFKDDSFESIASVDTISKLIGKHQVLTFDLHAEQSRFAFHDLRFDSLVHLLWKHYLTENSKSIPVFPDEGSAKRYGKILGVPAVVFRKKRDGAKRIVCTDDSIERGARYVIIDDLVRSGGTMNEVAKYLLSKGASSVDCLFAHAPLEPGAAKNLAIFNQVWTTDSCPHSVPREWVRLRVLDYIFDKFYDTV